MTRRRASAGAAVATAVALFFAVSAPAAPPTLIVEATDVVIGESIHATAELTESPDASGEISFEVFAAEDPDCEGTALAQSSATVSGEGEYESEDFEPTVAGDYHWTARYSGDEANEPAESACEAISAVSKASPELTGNATSGVVGGAIHDEVTLTGGFSAGGEVTFSVYGPGDTGCDTPLDTSTGTLSNDEASSDDFVPQSAGNFRWSASYPGDANNEPFELGCEATGQTSSVAKATPSLSGSASSGTVGAAIQDEVTLTGGASPGGEVTFKVYGPGDTTCATPLETTSATLASAKATSGNFLTQQAGLYRWTASYGGDANNEAVSLGCNASGQTSSVAKASPSLAATATSTVVVGNAITDKATLGGGFSPGGEIVFRAYGPGDATCGGAPAYEAAVTVSGNGPYSPAGFAPGPGLYRWTAEYKGDGNNAGSSLGCNASGQASAVGTIDVKLSASATGGTVGNPVTATATIGEGAIPGGQIVFKAFPPNDSGCSGAPAFSSTVAAAGNGSYRSAAFSPARVGSFRWTVAYSGDPNHAPATVGCGGASSAISQAKPTIAGAAPQRIPVGTAFRDAATLGGGFTPGGKITFRIYGPVASGCAGPAYVNTVAVNGNGTFPSDPFVPLRTGRYSFTASYSGDAENQAASEPCDSPTQIVQVVKRSPKVKPRATLVGRQISIRARLSGSVSPSGRITFRLFGPDDTRCRRKPKFAGGVRVKANGTFPLARYLATKPGTYRLSVGYTGDQRNRRFSGKCAGAQQIRIK
ncbi:MAG TPA: hypothetical protein VFZ29_00435 [Solirubrobacterales bacterium]